MEPTEPTEPEDVLTDEGGGAVGGSSKWKAAYDSKRRYQASWEERFPWVTKAASTSEHAFCQVCHKTLFPKLSVLQSHDRGHEHLRQFQSSNLAALSQEPELEAALDTPMETTVIVTHVDEAADEASTWPVDSEAVGADLGSQNVILTAARPSGLALEDEAVPRQLHPHIKRELLASDEDARHVLDHLVHSVDVDTLLDVAGPAICERAGLWRLLLSRAKGSDEATHAMEVVLKQTEDLLIELKALLQQCFSHVPEVDYGRGQRVKRKAENGLDLPDYLSEALGLTSGYYRQRFLEDIKYRPALNSGILLPLTKEPEPAPEAPVSQSGLNLTEAVEDIGDPEYVAQRKTAVSRKRRRMSCLKCGKLYRFKESLRKHEDSCEALLRYKKRGIKFYCLYEGCSQPNLAYPTKEDLLNHFDGEHFEDKDRTIPCTYQDCRDKFATILLMNAHVRKCHEKKFTCPHCPKKFWLERAMNLHVSKVHERPQDAAELEKDPLGKESTLCRKCGKMLSKNYMLTHESRCDGLFVRHPQWRKVGDEYLCTTDGCTLNHGFTCLYGLRVHFYASHLRDDEKVYSCEHCEQKFPCKISRNKHIKLQHLKPYQCDHCGRRFGARSKLDSHRLTHTGEKPFACDRCEYRTAKKYNLDEHKQKKHNDLGGRNYYCALCGKVFITPGRLTSHFRIVHDDGKNPEGTRKKGKATKTNSAALVPPLDGAQQIIVQQTEVVAEETPQPQGEQEIAVDFITTTLKEEDQNQVEFTMV